ncbi:MAG: pentapeptide repeat-containing protein [Deltaproteobacteria bacterium]|nr:pentapeptide repeat-containing protein [Deltaproteobacteria bacterium]
MLELDPSAYVLGRPTGNLADPYLGTDLTFGGARLDGLRIEKADFTHCTFANISFKEVVLNSSSFLNCVFVGCYFRRAEVIGSRFIGCKFLDCNFSHIAIKSCDFRHSSFRACQLPFAEIRYSLPSEPNLLEELARNLALESSRLGLSSEARQYRMTEIRAREAHLRAAISGESQWYREHFDGFARVRAIAQLSVSLGNRWLWGYGERARILVRNFLVLGLLIFPVAFWLVRDGLVHTRGSDIRAIDVVYFSLQNILPAGVESGVRAVGPIPRMIAGLEALFGVVAVALFASYVFRWSLHR